jgi:SAM-dependent methyltransferase
MEKVDSFNLTLVNSIEEVDQINKKFYGRYNYPWPPSLFSSYPGGIAEQFLNQDIGYWNHNRIPAKPKIWVAGCGTNQALFTALKFPEAEVLGTDISSASLAICKKNADQIGVKNLQFEEKSLNDTNHIDEFDYVICTGVVHHNAIPRATLSKISAALKKNGILEFMVYNYYHRLLTTACQKAIRNFYDAASEVNMDLERTLSQDLIKNFPYQSLMGDFLRSYAESHEAELADSLLQPVEYSYTIESLESLANDCNLECLLHCLNQFDVSGNLTNWNMKFGNNQTQKLYDRLPDLKRWQISNLLLFNNSPMLWFYFQRKDSNFVRKDEHVICEEFLETKFSRNSFFIKNYVLNFDGNYILSDKTIKHPSVDAYSDPCARRILQLSNSNRKMKDIFYEIDLEPTFNNVNDLRIKLTTLAFPYLLAM